jgi:ribosomal protein S18 acetylase RimI-like enzyme
MLLNNPVFHALSAGDAHLGTIKNDIAFFDVEVSPFVGFREGYENGFSDLHQLFSPGRKILYASRTKIETPEGWNLRAHIEGSQFVFEGKEIPVLNHSVSLVLLEPIYVAEMIALARLTKPGPFDERTIEFGHYYGVIVDGRLAAMTGQRLHAKGFSEISAVCTHPDFLGRGYAASLIQKQLELILPTGNIPFLHVRSDNNRAIALYERLGFRQNGPMHFYFMERT